MRFDFHRVSELILPINGVFVSLDGVAGNRAAATTTTAAAAVGGLGVLVWREGPSRQVDGLQGAVVGVGMVVVVVGVTVHPTHPVQPVVGQVFVLEREDSRRVTFDLWELRM